MLSINRFSLILALVGSVFGYAPQVNAQAGSNRPAPDFDVAMQQFQKSLADLDKLPEVLNGIGAYNRGDYRLAFQIFEPLAVR